MVKKMLIDASHQEEMRVVVVDGTRLDELDIETSTKKQLKGNIYLAKVARVEPSLQAAFVDYGGNRHGFLAFNEIHPDYYQIPVADREAIKEAMLRESTDDDDEEEEKPARESGRRCGRRRRPRPAADNAAETSSENTENASPAQAERVDGAPEITADDEEDSAENQENGEERLVETVSGNDPDDAMPKVRPHSLKRYKIQEVIHRGQVLLVQVTKEERGNKGAALTTYLSLAGRYCVLMPNNARGGGVSRKITNAADRKRLKSIVSELPLPSGMSVIVRTAGKERTKLEIKRDYEYLIKTWVQIRDTTMASSAPALIHEEGNLIKRALRDMYTRDISEILIEGDQEYRMAKDFMKMLTPSHAKKVQQYKDPAAPLFFRYQVEPQLEAMHSNIVQLKSGAYLVMDQTEALVAIDVNSGRATKERNIEETALKTNLEAADEIARQLRLRDMAGLVVIDFIDMEEPRNNHAVERRMKEALKRDRARVQMGRITGFGLMELSRQRLHSSFLETSYQVCPHCRGKGLMRSTESAAIHTLHLLEDEGIKRRFSEIQLTVPTAVALYVLNHKRDDLTKIEQGYNLKIGIEGDDSLLNPTEYRIERVVRTEPEEAEAPVAPAEEAPADSAETETQDEKPAKGNRSRRRPRRERTAPEVVEVMEEPQDAPDSWVIQEDVITEEDSMPEVIQADVLFEEGLKGASKPAEARTEEAGDEEKPRRSRYPRRDRRFQKRRPRPQGEEEGRNEETPETPAEPETEAREENPEEIEQVADAVENGEENQNRRRSPSHRRRLRPHTRPHREGEGEEKEAEASAAEGKALVNRESNKPMIVFDSHAPHPARKSKKAETAASETPKENREEPAPSAEPAGEPSGKKRTGWWQRLVK